MKNGFAIVLVVFGAPFAFAAAPVVDFAKDVAPLLERACIRCHQDGNSKGDVSLSHRQDLIDGKYVVPGKPNESGLLDLVRASANSKRAKMPKDGKSLSEDEIAVLSRWIEQGANWPKELVLKERAKADLSWWSLRSLADVPPPNPSGLPISWSTNPIDRFIYAKLQENKLTPSLPADARTLARRLSFDLTGLPLAPERIETFARDPSPTAYEKLVDELLASPAYGEQWGRHWLDVVRFGESNGYERNVIIDNLWPFRDYVIRSLNDDKPFDRFVLEHLVGDQLEPGNPAVEVATAFLVCGPYDNVGNQDPVQQAMIRANTLDEMIRATGEAFLGVTIGCARCHNHKFDPITQQDYYRLYATFAGVTHGARVVAPTEKKQDHAAKLAALNARLGRLKVGQSAILASIQSRSAKRTAELESRWTRPVADSGFTEDHFSAVDARYVRITSLARVDKPELASGFHLDEFEVWTAGPKSRNVALSRNGAKADGESRKAEDFADAYTPALTINGQFGAAWISAGPALTITLPKSETISRVVFSANRTTGTTGLKFTRPFVGEYRIDVSLDGKSWRTVAGSFDRKPASPTLRANRITEAVVSAGEREWLTRFAAAIATTEKAIAAVPPLPAWWVGRFQPANGPFHVFTGGDPQKKADALPASGPAFLSQVAAIYDFPANANEAERRLALARWIVSAKNPLTPRVLVNRLWHYHFGTGIVDTPSDFGYMGGRPTHPELLDYLARELRANGWRLKPLHRLIVTSQTYQQSSQSRAEAVATDGDSRFLWRFPPHRLSGEELRDAMLSVSGKLNPTLGGPGYRLYRYLEDNVATYVPLDAPGPETYRRAVYHQNARAARVDLLTDFDCPDPASAVPRRASTTTPLQALTLFNHRFTLDMAEALTSRVQQEVGTDKPAQIRRVYLLAYGRVPTPEESSAAGKLIAAHGLRAFCRAVLNSNEFLFVD